MTASLNDGAAAFFEVLVVFVVLVVVSFFVTISNPEKIGDSLQ